MNIFESSDGPVLDYGLQQRMQRLDPSLRVTYSDWCLDTISGQPIEVADTGKPIYFPAHHLWRHLNDGQWVWINWFPMIAGGFGHYNAYCLEIDKAISQSMDPENIYQMLASKKRAAEERAKDQHFAFRRDRALANRRRMWDLAVEGKSGYRDAKPSSYAGQTKRSTPGRVLSDARADGWEL